MGPTKSATGTWQCSQLAEKVMALQGKVKLLDMYPRSRPATAITTSQDE